MSKSEDCCGGCDHCCDDPAAAEKGDQTSSRREPSSTVAHDELQGTSIVPDNKVGFAHRVRELHKHSHERNDRGRDGQERFPSPRRGRGPVLDHLTNRSTRCRGDPPGGNWSTDSAATHCCLR